MVRPFPFVGDDVALVEALRLGQPAARAALFDRHAPRVQRVLARVLGTDEELGDLLHEVFVRALDGIGKLEDPAALEGWLTSIAVFTARGLIRRRKARRWLRFFATQDVPEPEAPVASPEVTRALRSTYRVLEQLPTDERIVFCLRVIDGMELTVVARACGVSLATIKRRLARAEEHFVARARAEPELADWLEGGARWAATDRT